MKEIILTDKFFNFSNLSGNDLVWSGSGFETDLICKGGSEITLTYTLTELPEKRCEEENFAPCLYIYESDVTLLAQALCEGRNKIEFKLSSLGKKHSLRFVKTGEYGRISDICITLPTDAAASKPKSKKKKRIFFIGDSMTAGLYNMRETSEDPAYYLPESQNSERSYASICAKNLGADFNIYAISGAPLRFMTDVFFERVQDEIPDLIVLYLGANDSRDSDGPWSERKERFVSDYKAVLTRLLEMYPNAKIVCLAGMMFMGHVPYVEKAVAEYKDERVFGLSFPAVESKGHPLASEQAKTAKSLMEFIFKNNLL